MAREPSRNKGSNFSDMPIKDAKPATDSKTGPAMQCTKQTEAITIPVLSPRVPREFASFLMARDPEPLPQSRSAESRF